MQTKDILLSVILPATPEQIYHAWIDSKIHGEIIEAPAIIDPKDGGKFSLWDNAIVGKTIELHPKTHTIVQEWRDNSSDWPKNYFSKVTVTIEHEDSTHAKLTLHHTGIPAEHVDSVKEGWENFYWKPMKKYFASAQ